MSRRRKVYKKEERVDSRYGSPAVARLISTVMKRGKKSLAAAEATLAELKALLDGSKLVEGKLSPATVKKAEKLLAGALDAAQEVPS